MLKLFTVLGGEELVQKKDFYSGNQPALSNPFLDRTVAARRSEMVAESTAGIIPGDRGKAGGNWCRLPLRAHLRAARHISPVPLAGVVSGQLTHD
jgi:hypothetical protein